LCGFCTDQHEQKVTRKLAIRSKQREQGSKPNLCFLLYLQFIRRSKPSRHEKSDVCSAQERQRDEITDDSQVRIRHVTPHRHRVSFPRAASRR
jgi:hypothetical protein